jgi:hypothetical protein
MPVQNSSRETVLLGSVRWCRSCAAVSSRVARILHELGLQCARALDVGDLRAPRIRHELGIQSARAIGGVRRQ